MQKIFLGTLVIVFALTLSACGNKIQTQEKEGVKEAQGEKAGVISSIKDAMGLGKKMKCTYKIKTEGEEFESISYIDGQRYRSESKIMGMTQVAIFDGGDMHSWSEGQKKGMKITKKCSEELQAQNQEMNQEMNQGEEKQNQEEFEFGAEKFDDAMDVKCEEVSSIDFSIPTDVDFVDQCEMMKGISQQMKNIKIPAGAGEGMGAGAGAGNGAGANMPNIPNIPNMAE